MKRVDVMMESLTSIMQTPEVVASDKTVQKYLIDWCMTTFNEDPIVTMISEMVSEKQWGITSKKRIQQGLSFEFVHPKNAVLFKLRWS